MNLSLLFKSIKTNGVQFVLVAMIFVALIIGYNLGKRSAPDTKKTADTKTESKTIWTCSMHPQIRMEQPGKCPICKMDLVEEKVEVAKKAEPLGYACAMNCVKPLPLPGKCPICGMEMQAVFEESGTSGDPQRTLTLSDEARALAKIETTTVERRWVENQVRMVGFVDYDETRLTDVTAYVGGRLDRLFVDFTGTLVRKNDHMVKLYSPELLSAQEELLQAKRAYENQSNTLPAMKKANLKSLNATRERLRLWGITEKQIEEIENRGTRTDHLTIYAPNGGIVIKKHVQEGAYVKTGDRIYTIADLSRLWVKFKAYESDLPWLRYGQEITFTTEAYPGEEFHGQIAFISPTLNKMSRTVDVRVNIDNAAGKLKPEMFVRAVVKSKLAKGGKVIEPQLAGKWISPMHPEIIKDGPGQCDVCGMDLVPAEELGFIAGVQDKPPLVIPVTAPLITGKRAVVYVELPDEKQPTYEGREIVLGPRAGDHYLVLNGLKAGDKVVTNGAFRIDSALQIIAKKSMMNPMGEDVSHAGHNHGGSGTKEVKKDSVEVTPAKVSSEFRQRLEPIYTSYFKLQQALAADDFKASISGAKGLQKSIALLDQKDLTEHNASACLKQTEVLKSALENFKNSKDIKTARKSFEEISIAILTLEESFGHSSEAEYFKVHCPMAFDFKGADWLQNNNKINNPYFGAEMLECGVVKKAFESMN